MPIYRKNPDGTRTQVTFPNGSRSGMPVSDGVTVPATAVPPAPILEPPPKRMRGHAIKNDAGKFMPTGDGPGFANPPRAHQFKKGGSGGPGRPRGSISYYTLVRKHLTAKRRIRTEGVGRQVSTAELILMMTIKDAVEGKSRDARKYVLAEMARAFPTQEDSQTLGARELNASDALSLAEYEAELREQLLAEIQAGNHDVEGADDGDEP